MEQAAKVINEKLNIIKSLNSFFFSFQATLVLLAKEENAKNAESAARILNNFWNSVSQLAPHPDEINGKDVEKIIE